MNARLPISILLAAALSGSCMLVGGGFDPDYEMAADGEQWVVSAARATWDGDPRQSVGVEFRGAAAEHLYEKLSSVPSIPVEAATERSGDSIRCRLYTERQEPGGDPLYVCSVKLDLHGKVASGEISEEEIPMDLSEAAVTVALPGETSEVHIRIGTHAGKEMFAWLQQEDAGDRFVAGDVYCLGFRPNGGRGYRGKIYRCGIRFDSAGKVMAPKTS